MYINYLNDALPITCKKSSAIVEQSATARDSAALTSLLLLLELILWLIVDATYSIQLINRMS